MALSPGSPPSQHGGWVHRVSPAPGAMTTPAGMVRGQRGARPGHGASWGQAKGSAPSPRHTQPSPHRDAGDGGSRLCIQGHGSISTHRDGQNRETSERWIEPQAGGIPADRRDSRRQGVCWRYEGDFPAGDRSLWETAQGGEGRGNSLSAWPSSPQGKFPGGRQSFPVCSLISIAGACPRAEVRGRLSPGSTSESLGQSSMTHVPGLWGQRDPHWAPLWDAAAGPASRLPQQEKELPAPSACNSSPALRPQGGQCVPSSHSQEFHLPSQPQERVPLLPASACLAATGPSPQWDTG